MARLSSGMKRMIKNCQTDDEDSFKVEWLTYMSCLRFQFNSNIKQTNKKVFFQDAEFKLVEVVDPVK